MPKALKIIIASVQCLSSVNCVKYIYIAHTAYWIIRKYHFPVTLADTVLCFPNMFVTEESLLHHPCSSRSGPHNVWFLNFHNLTHCLTIQELTVHINYPTYSLTPFLQHRQKLKIACYDLNVTGTAFVSSHLYVSAGISQTMWGKPSTYCRDCLQCGQYFLLLSFCCHRGHVYEEQMGGISQTPLPDIQYQNFL